MNTLLITLGVIGLLLCAGLMVWFSFKSKPAATSGRRNHLDSYSKVRGITVLLANGKLRQFRNRTTFCKHFGCSQSQFAHLIQRKPPGTMKKYGIADLHYSDNQGILERGIKPVEVTWNSGYKQILHSSKSVAALMHTKETTVKMLIRGAQYIRPKNHGFKMIRYVGATNRSKVYVPASKKRT